ENVSEINNVLDTYHKSIMNREITIDEGIASMNTEVGKILGN
ncbi:MAG: extracellular solute-binding protein family 1, partial [Herbinix sp.]|nr:extracellular solute-binding protein family 1 [Herbinix sp.]